MTTRTKLEQDTSQRTPSATTTGGGATSQATANEEQRGLLRAHPRTAVHAGHLLTHARSCTLSIPPFADCNRVRRVTITHTPHPHTHTHSGRPPEAGIGLATVETQVRHQTPPPHRWAGTHLLSRSAWQERNITRARAHADNARIPRKVTLLLDQPSTFNLQVETFKLLRAQVTRLPYTPWPCTLCGEPVSSPSSSSSSSATSIFTCRSGRPAASLPSGRRLWVRFPAAAALFSGSMSASHPPLRTCPPPPPPPSPQPAQS